MPPIEIKDANGATQNLKSSTDGTDEVTHHNVDKAGIPFGIQAAMRTYPRLATVNKFGLNADIDTASAPEDLWSGGGKYVFPNTAGTLDISSDNAADTVTGTGAQLVVVVGLDENWNLSKEIVALDGTTPITTIDTYIRVFRAYVEEAGSSGVNTGIITCQHNTLGASVAQIDAGEGQALMAVYTVPAGKTAYMDNWYGSMIKDGKTADLTAVLRLKAKENIDPKNPIRTKHVNGLCIDGTTYFNHEYHVPKEFIEKTDIWIEVSNVSKDGAALSGGFDLYVVDNV